VSLSQLFRKARRLRKRRGLQSSATPDFGCRTWGEGDGKPEKKRAKAIRGSLSSFMLIHRKMDRVASHEAVRSLQRIGPEHVICK
jgi:hypothetical protein